MKTAKKAWLDFINEPKSVEDPKSWFTRGWQFHAVVNVLIKLKKQKVVDGAKIKDVAELLAAYNTAPHMAATAIELYMKGFLIAKGLSSKDVIVHGHNLPKLWEMCKGLDPRFNHSSIKLLSAQLYDHLVVGGGIRYPSKRNAPIYEDDFPEALDLAKQILKEVLSTD